MMQGPFPPLAQDKVQSYDLESGTLTFSSGRTLAFSVFYSLLPFTQVLKALAPCAVVVKKSEFTYG